MAYGRLIIVLNSGITMPYKCHITFIMIEIVVLIRPLIRQSVVSYKTPYVHLISTLQRTVWAVATITACDYHSNAVKTFFYSENLRISTAIQGVHTQSISSLRHIPRLRKTEKMSRGRMNDSGASAAQTPSSDRRSM